MGGSVQGLVQAVSDVSRPTDAANRILVWLSSANMVRVAAGFSRRCSWSRGLCAPRSRLSWGRKGACPARWRRPPTCNASIDDRGGRHGQSGPRVRGFGSDRVSCYLVSVRPEGFRAAARVGACRHADSSV